MAFNSKWKYYEDSKTNTFQLSSMLLEHVTNDTLHHDLDVPYVRDEIKRPSQRYADSLEEHPHEYTTNLMRNAKTSD
jgi:hypothetical protein